MAACIIWVDDTQDQAPIHALQVSERQHKGGDPVHRLLVSAKS